MGGTGGSNAPGMWDSFVDAWTGPPRNVSDPLYSRTPLRSQTSASGTPVVNPINPSWDRFSGSPLAPPSFVGSTANPAINPTSTPTNYFEQAFRRAMTGAPARSTGTSVSAPTVPRGTGSGSGSGGSGKTTPASTPAGRTTQVPISTVTPNIARDLNFMEGLGLKLPEGMKGVVGRGKTGATGTNIGQTNLGSILESAAPFIDNLGNILNPIPKLNQPSLLRTPQLETSHNIEPFLQEARRGLRTTNKAIDRSVGQGNVAAAYKAGALSDYLRAVGGATNTKTNTERQLRNQQAQATSNVDAANTQILNNYDMQLTGRQEAQRLARIGQLNNLGEDFLTMRNDRLLRGLDVDKFKVLAEMFRDVIGSSNLKNAPEFQFGRYGGKIRKPRKY